MPKQGVEVRFIDPGKPKETAAKTNGRTKPVLDGLSPFKKLRYSRAGRRPLHLPGGITFITGF